MECDQDESVCVECGHMPCVLVRRFPGGIIKIEQCDQCGQIADKYIEYDAVVIFLDTLLHKRQAYRHMLYNTHIQWHWKLFVMLLLCESFVTWESTTSQLNPELLLTSQSNFLVAVLSLNFYKIVTVILIDWLILIFVVSLAGFFLMNNDIASNLLFIIRGMVVSSYGKLIAIPILLWDQSQNPLCLTCCTMFVFTSNLVAFKVLCRTRIWTSIAVLSIAYLLRAIQHHLFIEV